MIYLPTLSWAIITILMTEFMFYYKATTPRQLTCKRNPS